MKAGANTFLLVPTTIHVPDQLLEREEAGWSPELVRMLTSHPVSHAAARELEATMAKVSRSRRSKRRPPNL